MFLKLKENWVYDILSLKQIQLLLAGWFIFIHYNQLKTSSIPYIKKFEQIELIKSRLSL